MNLSLRQKVYVALAGAIFLLHISIAFFAKPSFALTMVGDVIPCAMLVIAILSFANNFGQGRGLLPLFWKLAASGVVDDAAFASVLDLF